MMIVLFSADNVSLYDELANSIEEQEEDPFPLPLPELGGHTESAKIHLKLNYVTCSCLLNNCSPINLRIEYIYYYRCMIYAFLQNPHGQCTGKFKNTTGNSEVFG